jgi:hypothetical protein
MMRFSIRDLLWATLVVAMGLGWWMSYRATTEHYEWLLQDCLIEMLKAKEQARFAARNSDREGIPLRPPRNDPKVVEP